MSIRHTHRTFVLHLLPIFLIALLATACTKPVQLDQLIETYVPADATMAGTVNISNILDNAGIDVADGHISDIEAAINTLNISSKHREDIRALLSLDGFDIDGIVYVSYIDREEIIFAFPINNKAGFIGALENNDSDLTRVKKDNATILYTEDCTFVIYDDRAFFVPVTDYDKALRIIDRFKVRAQQSPLPKWKVELLANAADNKDVWVNMLDIKSVADLMRREIQAEQMLELCKLQYGISDINGVTSVSRLNLDGKTASITTDVRDSEGNILENKWFKNKIDIGPFKPYIDNNDILTIAMALSDDIDYSEMFNNITNTMAFGRSDRQVFEFIGQLMNDVDGTIMLTAGTSANDLYEMREPKYYHVMLGAKMKPGKAFDYLNMLEEWIRPYSFSCSRSGNELTVVLPEEIVINASVKDNLLVISNSAANPGLHNALFDDIETKTADIRLLLPKGHILAQQAKLTGGLVIDIQSNSKELILKAEVTDTDNTICREILSLDKKWR